MFSRLAPDDYVDGGVTNNVPRRCAERLAVVLVNPITPAESQTYRDAIDVGFGVFDTMQHLILEYQVRLAFFEGCAFQVWMAR